MSPVRVLVVDDSPLIRQIFIDMLRREDDIEVVGYARDGEEALLRIAETSPDVVTLDMEMPRLDGLGCLRELMRVRPVPAVMVSTLSPAGAATLLDALALGAVDSVCKPEGGSLSTLRGVREELVAKVRGARGARVQPPLPPGLRPDAVSGDSDRVVLVAASTGGPRSLAALLAGIPQGFAAPMLIAQRLHTGFVDPLAGRLTEIGPLEVRVAKPGDRMAPDLALLAPGGEHMTVTGDGVLRFDSGPSADRLFASAAEAFGGRCIAVVLSGAGLDGAEGALAVRTAGGEVLVESEETCTVFETPQATLFRVPSARAVPIEALGAALSEAARGMVAA